MTAKIETITGELKRFFDSEFQENGFMIVYGSYAYGVNTSSSDLDFVTIARKVKPGNLQRTLDFAFDLYRKHGLALDNEVPHEKKLLADYKTLESAIRGGGFERRDGSIYVPKIVKTPEFLSSDEIAMRLLLNAMTSKNILVGGDQKHYSRKRNEALENMVAFIFSATNRNSFTIPEFTQALISAPERQGEMYLGYKNKPAIREYLAKTFARVFEELSKRNLLKNGDGRFYLNDPQWIEKCIKDVPTNDS